jgi:hypothetical protein
LRWDLYCTYPAAFSEPPPKPASRLTTDMICSDRALAPAPRPTSAAKPSALTPETIEKIVNKRVVEKMLAEFGNEPQTHRTLEAAGYEVGPPADALGREAAAFEESGHGIMGDSLGLKVRDLFITRAGTGQYNTVDLNHKALASDDPREEVKRNVSIYMAGAVAQRIKYGRVICQSPSDQEEIRKYLSIFSAQRDALLAEADAFTEATLRERWHEVERVAVHLQLYGKLDAERFYSLIETRVGKQRQVRRVQLPMATRSASVTSGGDTIEVCWGSGAMVKRGGYDPYYEDLPAANADLSWMNTGKCPLLDSHNSSRTSDVFGVVKAGSAFVRDSKGYATITLGSNAPDGIKDGTLRNISIGYSIGAMKLNGKAADGLPIYTVESYRILECSIVPVPADKGAEILRKYPAEVRG